MSPAGVDIGTFTNERPAFCERLAKLSGMVFGFNLTPTSPRGTVAVPDAHAMAAALAMARRGQRDIGPEIAVAIYCATDLWRPRIVAELTSAWLQTVTVSRRYTGILPMIAGACYEHVVYGRAIEPCAGIKRVHFDLLVSIGCMMLVQSAENSVDRAARAYYATGDAP